MAQQNASFQIDGKVGGEIVCFCWLLSLLAGLVDWICKMQKGNCKEKGKKGKSESFTTCKGKALQKQSGSALRAREGRKASKTRTRLPATGGGNIYATRPLARLTRAVTWAVSWMGWQLFWCTMSGGRKLWPVKALDREASIFQHTRGWITHAKPPPERWTVSTKPPASSPALSPDQSCSFPGSHTSGTQLSGLAFYKQDDFHETGIQISGKFYC